GPDTMTALGRMRVPDNLGTPTDETYHTVLFTVRAPVSSAITSRTSSSVSWTSLLGTPGIKSGTQRRWELRLPGGVSDVRDGSGTVRCSAGSPPCTSSNNFAQGAVIESRSSSVSAHQILSAPPAFSGVTAPAAPFLTPWRAATAGKVAVRVGLLGADSTSWELSCASGGDVVTSTGSAPGLVSLTGKPGFWTCRSRGVRSLINGAWGPALVVHARPQAAASTGLTGGNGTISMAAGSNSFVCNKGASSVSGSGGQTVNAAVGQWYCYVTFADTSTAPVSVSVHEPPAAPASVALTASAGRAVLSYTLPASTTTADDPVTVTCTGANPYSGTVAATSVDLGALAAGSTSCSVTRSYWTADAGSAASTAAGTVTSTLVEARQVTFTQVGDGSVTSTVSALSRSSAGTSATSVNDGTSITFTATPAAGWVVSSWSVNGCSGRSCTATLTGAVEVSANVT
ncbi:MAG: hypothetical protein ACKORY_08465, partial [Actinomycetota bacterium]